VQQKKIFESCNESCDFAIYLPDNLPAGLFDMALKNLGFLGFF